MAEKGRRAADRRRERMGDDALDAPVGDKTDLHTIGGEWIGDESGVLGGVARPLDGATGPGLRPEPITDELPLVDEAERVAAEPPEETVYEDRARPRAPMGARVLVIDGKDKGLGQDLIFSEVIIGRSGRSDLILKDETVSREHCALRFVGSAFEVVDLGSESGTFLNGQEVSRATLKPGDEIEIGETVLRFLRSEAAAPGDRPQVEEEEDEGTATGAQPRRRSTRSLAVVLVMVVVAVLFMAVAALGVLYYLHTVGKVRVVIDPGLQALLDEARADLEAGRRDEARVSLKAYLDARPHDQEAQRLLSQIDLLETEDALVAELERAARGGDVERAEELLANLPEGASYRERARAMIAAAKEEQRNANLDAARRLADEGHLDAAEKMLDKHEERWPDDEEAQALRAQIMSLREQLRADQNAKLRAETAAALSPAAQAFARGQPDESRALLGKLAKHPQHGAAARQMAQQIDTFFDALARGRKAHRQKQAGSGLQALEQALRIDRELAPGGSAYTREAGALAADLHYLRGVAQLGQGKACDARQSFERALRLKPGDAKSREQLTRLVDQAETELAKARGMASGDPARAKKRLRAARCLVERGSPTGRKIDALLKSIR